MANYQTSLPMVFELAKKVQETGRTKNMFRTFSGTSGEISSYAENVRAAIDGLNDAVCSIGCLMTNLGEFEGDKAHRLGWLLTTIGEMQNVLSNEAFALSERADK